MLTRQRHRIRCLLFTALLVATSRGLPAARAQGLPTDADMDVAVRVTYNHLGLLEYCRDKGFVSEADIGNMVHVVNIQIRGLRVTAESRAAEGTGRHGTIIGDQVIGLIDASNPKRPEHVLAGQTVTLTDNAKAQNVSERTLCEQMAAQVAPLR